ncbi:polysaccharide deacetylase family protein [Streptomyces sp. NPDC020858]|uniref:polysaccharide deacetylase family protein n=1 Tax=Streptomyces sp. NPDC020858 TaxID=3365097 RepID=UPI00378D8B98
MALTSTRTARRTARLTARAALAAAVLTPMVFLGTGTGTATALPATGTGTGTGTDAPGTSAQRQAPPVAANARAAQPAPAPPASVPLTIARSAAGGARDVAITIDDGPDPVWTPQVLDVLKQNNVKATFCMIGTNAQKYPDLVKDVVAAGHRLCDHSVSHDTTMDHKPVAFQQREILDGKAMIERAAPGATVDYYRAPGGAFTPDSRQIAAAQGMRPLGWSVDPEDWSRPGAAAIVSAVEQQEQQPHPTVLFHDGGGDRSQTVAALREVLPWFAQRGYSFTFPVRTAP